MRTLGSRLRHDQRDAGFTLTELVMAMAVFAVFCSASLGLLVRTGSATRENLQRTAAANLASEQIQIARSLSAIDIPLGTITRTRQVSGTTYTIAQSSRFLSADATTSVCTGTATVLAYKLVSVKVSWPNATTAQAVRQDTLKAVGIGASGLNTTGVLALLVSTSSGVPAASIPITLNNGSTATTDETGCAVFTGLGAGSYSATVNVPGYVGLGNLQQTIKAGLGVTVGAVSRGAISYDTTRSVAVAVSSPVTGGVLPTGLPIRLSSGILGAETAYPNCPATGTPSSACATAPTGTANGQAQELYPTIYTVKLGACTEALPSQSLIDLSSASSSGSTVTVPLGAVTVNMAQGVGTFAGTKTITVSHALPYLGCSSGETYTFTGAASGVKLLLPYGTWTVSVPVASTGATATTQNVVLTPAARTATSSLTVTS